MKLLVQYIETPNYFYIKNDESSYSSYSLNKLIINDGLKLEDTNKERWYKTSEIPTKIQIKLPQKPINIRFELKKGYPESDLCPKVINQSSLYDTKWEDVDALYEEKFDLTDAGFEDVEFELKKIATRNYNFEFKTTDTINKHKVSYGLLDEIETHPDLLFEKPCTLSSNKMYDIVQDFLSSNVDNKYAELDMSYNWRIKVNKKIKLAKSYTTRHDIRTSRQRKPRWINKQHTNKTITVIHFENSSSCKKYPPSISGKDIEDLQVNLDKYLNSLLVDVNEPYSECPHCNGLGVLNGDGSVIEKG